MSSNKKVTTLSVNEIRPDKYKELQRAAYNNDLKRLQERLDEFVAVKCPACGSSDVKYRFKKYKCRFVECCSCETLYMSPRPSPEVMDDYYTNSENYAVWNKYIFPNSEDSRREKICYPNLKRIISECQKLGIKDPSLLEIGPGFGTFAEIAQKSGFFSRVTVIERTPEMALACEERGLEVIQGSLEEVTIDRSDGVDIVVCYEVIEHVFSPIEFINKFRELLRPGGLFVFTCPNGNGFDTMMLQEDAPAVDTEHVNLFNPASISLLLEQAGFETLSVKTLGRLDVEIVRQAILDGETSFNIDAQPFWKKILFDESLGNKFQQFLSDNNLSGNMWGIARKKLKIKN